MLSCAAPCCVQREYEGGKEVLKQTKEQARKLLLVAKSAANISVEEDLPAELQAVSGATSATALVPSRQMSFIILQYVQNYLAKVVICSPNCSRSHGCHWSGKIQGQGKVGEFCAGSGKFEILRKVREIPENPLKAREI